MKKIYYILAMFFGLIGFVIALQNIDNTAITRILFEYSTGSSLFSPFLLLLIIGMASGFFLGMALMKKSVSTATGMEDL